MQAARLQEEAGRSVQQLRYGASIDILLMKLYLPRDLQHIEISQLSPPSRDQLAAYLLLELAEALVDLQRPVQALPVFQRASKWDLSCLYN